MFVKLKNSIRYLFLIVNLLLVHPLTLFTLICGGLLPSLLYVVLDILSFHSFFEKLKFFILIILKNINKLIISIFLNKMAHSHIHHVPVLLNKIDVQNVNFSTCWTLLAPFLFLHMSSSPFEKKLLLLLSTP